MHRKETPRFNWQPHGFRDPRGVCQSSKGCDPAAHPTPIPIYDCGSRGDVNSGILAANSNATGMMSTLKNNALYAISGETCFSPLRSSLCSELYPRRELSIVC